MRAFQAPAPPLAVPAPELTVVEQGTTPEGKRRLRLRLTSPRGAAEGVLYIPVAAPLESAVVEGRSISFANPTPGGPLYSILRLRTLPPQGIEIEVVLGESAPQEWYVVDQSYGLPPGGEALQKARPATAVSFQDGDVTAVSRKVRI